MGALGDGAELYEFKLVHAELLARQEYVEQAVLI
jgi:hypothetical protein